jgi:hypothetical protein
VLPLGSFSRDEILTNVTLYWLTGTIGSSMRMYRAGAARVLPPLPRGGEVGIGNKFGKLW